MVDDAHEQGVIEENEAEMIQNIMEFSDKEAQDIMTHRKNVSAIEVNTPLAEALSYMLNGSNSRYPVYREDIDDIIGILHLKDAMKQMTFENKGDVPVGQIPELIPGRPPIFRKPEASMICSNGCRPRRSTWLWWWMNTDRLQAL